MSLYRRTRLSIPALLASLLLAAPLAFAASEFSQYKDLRSEYLKVTDVRERERTEERYVENAGKVSLQQLPFKEVQVTAELTQKPPSTMDNMFSSSKEPYFKICMTPFDASGQPLEEDCQTFRFQSLVKGNVGTAAFRLSPQSARYEFHLTQKLPDKGSSFKLWTPKN